MNEKSNVQMDESTIVELMTMPPRARVGRITTILRERYGLTDYVSIQAVNRVVEDALAVGDPQ